MGHSLWFSNKIESKKCVGHIKQFFTVISHSNWWAIKMNLTRFDSFLGRILVRTYLWRLWHVVFWSFRRLKCFLYSKILIFKVLALNYLLLPLNKCSQSIVFAVFSPLNTIERGRTRSGKKDNFLVFTHHNQTWRSYKYVRLF